MKQTESNLTCKELSFTYPGQKKPVLQDLSFSVDMGQFVVLCGASGSGKTTLLRQLKPALTPAGKKSGTITLGGLSLEELSPKEQAQRIGFVLQAPEQQVVTDRVWHELAFGLESLGLSREQIRLRVAEMVSFFGMEDWFYEEVSHLSGGQKQLLNVASVLVMQPDVLVLDEPTSQLDPVAAANFFDLLVRINRQLGITILLTEHRLEEVLPLCDRVLVLEEGRLLADGTASEVGQALKAMHHPLFSAMPAAMRLYDAVPNTLPCPVSVREGRNWLSAFAKTHPLTESLRQEEAPKGDVVLKMDRVFFRYEKEGKDIVKDLSFEVRRGSLFALLGGNGAGKTTILSLLSGLEEPQRGTVYLEGKPLSPSALGDVIGLLPQQPQSLFVKQTVEQDLLEVLEEKGLEKEEKQRQVAEVASLCQVGHLMAAHPYDLSGGEAQRVAFAKVLLLRPSILLLDEPTKGLDAPLKETFGTILKQLTLGGTTIFMVSHDVEFCASFADWCALLFDGAVASAASPAAFFSGNRFYTTSANRIARDWLPKAITVEEVAASCGAKQTEKIVKAVEWKKAEQPLPKPKTPLWRKGLAGLCFLLSLWMGGAILSGTIPLWLQRGEGLWGQYGPGVLFLLFSMVAGLLVLGEEQAKGPVQVPKNKRKLPKRTVATVWVLLLLIPATLFFGSAYLGNRKYYFISLLVLLETMAPFFLVYEGRKPTPREVVLLAVLCAMAVAGRLLFFFLPQFKPAAALAILSGVAFGGETGFLVGSVSMLLSNFYFGQSPMTPFQMVGMGMVGFFAGLLFQKGWLRRNRAALCVYGFLAVLVFYGGLLNPAVLFVTGQPVTKGSLAMVYLTGLPMDLVHGASTVFFLAVGAKPMLEKLDRIKEKYGFFEKKEE